jgi:hypothetical protein
MAAQVPTNSTAELGEIANGDFHLLWHTCASYHRRSLALGYASRRTAQLHWP